MPNPMQQFRLWRDFGGQNPGLLGSLSKWNEFTGERRAAYINNQFIGAIEGLAFAAVFIAMTLTGTVNIKLYIGLAVAFGLVGFAHFTVMLKRRETYVQLKIRERKAIQQKSEENFRNLADYADGVRKGYVR